MTEDEQPRFRLPDLRDIRWGEFSKLRRDLRAHLREHGVLFSADDHGLCFHALALFDFDSAPAYDDHEALNEQCLHILALLDSGTDAKDVESVERCLVKELLGFRTTPGSERNHLLEEALKDLNVVERNLDEMHALPGVADYRRDPHQRPRNHESRTNVEFFKRNLDERAAITHYLVSELDDAALRRADEERHSLRHIMPLWFEPAPYPMREPRGAERLRPDRIDAWHHRVLPLPVSKGRRLGDLYTAGDKEQFYTLLHQHIPPAGIFDQLQQATKELPRLDKRKPIIDECQALYNSKLWHAFYALALTQVEGLFAEMLDVVDPLRRTPKALTDKVIALRTIAPLHERSYDYFQYVLPRSRNVFLHRGLDGRMQPGDIRLACYDLLHDLGFLVQVFEELEDPLIWLHQVIARDAKDEEINLKWLARFIATLDHVHTRLARKDQQGIDAEDEKALLAKAVDYVDRHFKANDAFEKAVLPALLKRFNSLADGLIEAVKAKTAAWQLGHVDLSANDPRVGRRDEDVTGIVDDALTVVDPHGELLTTAEQFGRITTRLDWLSEQARDSIQTTRTEHSRFISNLKRLANARE